ncbi:MAG: hypothetical protein ABG776_15075, partial [Cyanobacteria bacterium J06555_13]
EIFNSYKILKDAITTSHEYGYEVDEMYFAYQYTPNKTVVTEIIQEIEAYIQKTKPSQEESKQAGYKFEELMLAVFHGVQGWSSLKSYQSAGPQYDLLISGEGPLWKTSLSMALPGIREGSSTIVVEAKATKSRVSDQQFARLCSLMETNLPKTCSLGVFFTINGASGFPKRGTKKQRNVGSSRLRQLLFYAKTGKPIVVFDMDDVRCLTENGSLLRILGRKVRDIEELTGMPVEQEDVQEVILPNNLEALRLRLSSQQQTGGQNVTNSDCCKDGKEQET